MLAKYGDIVVEGFTGDRVADRASRPRAST